MTDDRSPEQRMHDAGVIRLPVQQPSPAPDPNSPPPDGGGGAGVIAEPLDPSPIPQIPPRQWAYGHFLLFGSAAVLGAVDGGGKGAIAVATMLAMITGKPLLGEQVWRTGPVAIVSYEDDETEWRRRIAAACLHYKLDYAEVLSKVHFITRPDRRVTFAAQGGAGVVFPDSEEIIRCLTSMHAALLIIDPFNHAHSLEDGNSNAMIAKVAGEMARIAQVTKMTALVLHHLRKGATGAPDDLMGATSLRATFRSCRILARMDPEMAKKMNIADPWRYIRVAGSKENYAPPPERGTWFRLVGVPLGNATEAYPEGDNVAVATTWQPRQLFAGMDATALAAVFADLRQTEHGPNKQAKHTPWAGVPLMDIGKRSEREAGQIVREWLESGVLTKGKYYHTPSRHEVEQVVLDDAKAAQILADIEAANVSVE